MREGRGGSALTMASGAIPGRPSKAAASGQFLLALTIGVCGGGVFAWLHLPLAWMLGSMLACTVAATLGAPIAAPGWSRPPLTVVIGLMLGASFTPNTLHNVTQWLPTVSGLVVYLVAGGVFCVLYLRWVARYDPITAFYSGMPGGLTDMVIMGEQSGGDVRIIALTHSCRVLLVVSALPLLFAVFGHISLPPRPVASWIVNWSASGLGWAAASAIVGIAGAHLLRLPTKYLFGPMAASAVVHATGLSEFTPPQLLLNIAQVGLGVVIGCRFRGARLGLFLPVLLHSAVVSAILLSITVSFATLFSRYLGTSFLQVVLAYSPGGLTEMSLIAVSLQLDVAFVAAHHLLRIFLVVIAAQFLGLTLFSRKSRDGPN